jgi:protein-tyrosine phosphatase
MGNICRSPTAEAVFRHAIEKAGLTTRIDCDSAGTHDYHVGEPSDERARQIAERRGYDMTALRARQVHADDFEHFDYILAMDRANLILLKEVCPSQYLHKLALYCDYAEKQRGGDVPDPYFGGSRGFEQVLDLVEEVTSQLIAHVQTKAAR